MEVEHYNIVTNHIGNAIGRAKHLLSDEKEDDTSNESDAKIVLEELYKALGALQIVQSTSHNGSRRPS